METGGVDEEETRRCFILCRREYRGNYCLRDLKIPKIDVCRRHNLPGRIRD